MMKHLSTAVLLSLAAATVSFPALGGEPAQSRIAWNGTSPQSDKIVEWVYEGCAAYPVTKEATSTAASSSKPDTSVLSKDTQSSQALDHVDHAQAQ